MRKTCGLRRHDVFNYEKIGICETFLSTFYIEAVSYEVQLAGGGGVTVCGPADSLLTTALRSRHTQSAGVQESVLPLNLLCLLQPGSALLRRIAAGIKAGAITSRVAGRVLT